MLASLQTMRENSDELILEENPRQESAKIIDVKIILGFNGNLSIFNDTYARAEVTE